METGVKSTHDNQTKMETQASESVLQEFRAMEDSTTAIWRDISNQWFQEEAGNPESFVADLEERVRLNVSYIQNLLEEPRFQNVRVKGVLSDLEPFRQIVTTGENWLAVHHPFVSLSFVREGEILTEVSYTGIPEFSLTLRLTSDNQVVVSVNNSDVYAFEAVEGKNHRYFVI